MELFFANMWIAAQQVLILYSMVAVGFVLDKLGVFVEKTARLTNNLLFYVITPAVIIKSFLTTPFAADTAVRLGVAALCAAGTHVCGILVTLPLFRKKSAPHNPVYKFACVYGNMGYMALPLAQALLGDEGVLYCSMGVLTFQLFCFTHGVFLMNSGKGEVRFSPKKLLLNPGVIAVVIGLPIFLLKIKAPALLLEPVSSIAAMNTPLAMILLGTYMSNCGLRTLFQNRGQYPVTLVKNIVTPLVMLLVFRLCGVTGALLVAAVIQASAPSANNTVMFAAMYGRDTGVATKTVTFSTFASILTMPCMIALAQL